MHALPGLFGGLVVSEDSAGPDTEAALPLRILAPHQTNDP
jgi:hypothetical protein